MTLSTSGQALDVAERLLGLLDDGLFSATYKFAVLVGLLDLALEKTSHSGSPPDLVTTRELAEKVVALYWRQADAYETSLGRRVLRQSSQRSKGPSGTEIVDAIVRFRHQNAEDPSQTLLRAKLYAPREWENLVRDVEWKLIEMPIGKLQRIGQSEDRFLYEYSWTDEKPASGQVRAYQRGESMVFDNRLMFRPGVAESLVRLNTVLRPALLREWLLRVVAFNRDVLWESSIDEHLFGHKRVSLGPVRDPLRDLQDGRCFYCAGGLSAKVDVDHFIPWARHPNDSIENLVVSHSSCNNRKRDFLATSVHVVAWRRRMAACSQDLKEIAQRTCWPQSPEATLGVARALYLALPAGARLWRIGDDFESVSSVRESLRSALLESA